MSEVEAGNTLREELENQINAAEEVEIAAPAEVQTEAPEVTETPEQTESRVRDEAGRFARKQEEIAPPPVVAPVEQPSRPTTWKKEFLPIWDKLSNGQPLKPDEARKLAQYSQQREKEYATGVSTYRAEAEQARHLQEAIAPFIPNLQKANLNPTQWISNLGRAHEILALGSVDQKVQAFHKLAQDYNIPMAAIQSQAQGGVAPIVTQLMQQIQALQGQVSNVSTWREQQEAKVITDTIDAFSRDTVKHPHFEAVKATMAQLLESGLANDLETAYSKAVRFNDDVWEQERQAQLSTVTRSTAVAKAKAAAVSPRTTTPSGQVSSGAKDRRSIIAEQLEASMGGRV